MKLKIKWFFITLFIIVAHFVSLFLDRYYPSLIWIDCINSGIFGYLVGYSTFKVYLYENDNY